MQLSLKLTHDRGSDRHQSDCGSLRCTDGYRL